VLVSRPSSMADNDKVSLSLMLGLVPELSFVANIVTRIRIRIVAYLVGELVSCLSSEVLCHLLCTCCRSLDLRLSLLDWLGDGETALQQYVAIGNGKRDADAMYGLPDMVHGPGPWSMDRGGGRFLLPSSRRLCACLLLVTVLDVDRYLDTLHARTLDRRIFRPAIFQPSRNQHTMARENSTS
jgi:hypothetical protein